jgi:hypothetical protein
MRRRPTSQKEDVAEAKAPAAAALALGGCATEGTTPAPANNAGEERTDSVMLKVLALMQQQQELLQQELRASMQQQQAAMQQQQEAIQQQQQEWQASMQQQMQLLQTFMGNQMPILMATQTGVSEVTVGLQGVAADVQLMDGRMQKLESNLAAMQQCTDDRMRKFDAQQRVTEAQIHGAVASAHDMKLQLQAEVAINIKNGKH